MSEKAKGSQIDISGTPLPSVLNTMQQDIDTKASSSYVDTELAKKSDTEYVNTQLLLKADSSSVALALATKADASALAGLASETYVNNAVSSKADASALNGLASETYVDNAVSTKADSIAVANALDTKADASAVSSALEDKADASALSTLDSAVVKKAELKQTTGGSEDTPMSQKAVTQAIAAGVGENIVREAPEDGKQYARKDGAWEEVVASGDVEEAPEDGKQYARKDGAWEEVVASGDVEEAPIDGKTYVRSDGAWAEIDYVAPVTKNFLGVDPVDDGQWAPTYLDFPDTSKIYKGTIDLKSEPGEVFTYTASYLPPFEAWLVEVVYYSSPFTYLTSDGIQGPVIASLNVDVTSGLPAGIDGISGVGIFDTRSYLGIDAPSRNSFVLTIDTEAGYGDVLLETALYPEGEIPLILDREPLQELVDKIGDDLGLMPSDLYSLLGSFNRTAYGFTKGEKYWEVNREYGRTPISSLDAYKLTVKSASDSSHRLRIPFEGIS